jgi:glycosyltransferase involved in cell wall biosynthesis
MRVLITTACLDQRSGTETYVLDLALELQRQGHQPAVYTLKPGELSRQLVAQGIPVATTLRSGWFEPDLIHGHHHLPTLAALSHYPRTPAIHICHDHLAWVDRTPVHDRILRHLAVSRLCLDRVVAEGVPRPEVALCLNWVDVGRFLPRPPLPALPRRAMVFSNYANGDTHLPAVQEACRRAGIALEAFGAGVGRIAEQPERVLGDYDLVFAKAKAALEAMAVGSAVILCDFGGTGPLVTSRNLEDLRPLNFGFEALRNPLDPDHLLTQIACYDADDAARVRDRIRSSASLEAAVGGLVTIYGQVLEAHRLPRMQQASTPPWAPWTLPIRLRMLRWYYRALQLAVTPAGMRLKRVPGWRLLRAIHRKFWIGMAFKHPTARPR